MDQNVFQVAVIDDDREDFIMIRRLLEQSFDIRYQTQWISTFEAAEVELRMQHADAYLIDYQLGARTGLELLKNLCGSDLRKPMILLTGYGDREIDLLATEMGICNFLSKNHLSCELLERCIRYGIRRSADQEKLRLAEKFKAEKDAAELLNQAKSRFVANVTHEVRSPLSAMVGFAELALDPDTSEAERLRYLGVIKKNGKFLLNLVNDILDFSKLESGQFELKMADLKLSSVIQDVIELMRPVARSKGLQLDVTHAYDAPDLLRTDGNRVRQILLNIVSNALKFTSEGSISIESRALPGTDPSRALLAISIRDTGVGISVDDQVKLFQAYQQGEAGISQGPQGTGLGLNLSRQLAQALGGDLKLSVSTLGKGSTFTLTLPYVASHCPVIADWHSSQAHKVISGAPMAKRPGL